MRAAFKAVMDGMQVAMLVPDHRARAAALQTFRERLARLSRAGRDALALPQRRRAARASSPRRPAASVDILIGTHRLLQKDVAFKNLGLVIIDEEQRFGVAHKERLKQMRQRGRRPDALRHADPAHAAHVAGRHPRHVDDETPPEERAADQDLRGGVRRPPRPRGDPARARARRAGLLRAQPRAQHRARSRAKLRDIVPEADVGIGHGQMHEDQLEHVDARLHAAARTTCWSARRSSSPASTSRTSTRSSSTRPTVSAWRSSTSCAAASAAAPHRAYAYLLYEQHRALSEVAQKRLQAIFEATELGAGFQIALRDLEIRGAGNLLGAEQSGHMAPSASTST